MTLRRRGELQPLGRERRVVEGGQDSSHNVFGHYVSPCEFRVSNDPLEVSDQDVCETKIVGCVRDHEFLPGTIGQTKEIKLKYEYDLYYKFDNTNDNFWGMMDFLEGAMLEHVASPAVLDKEQCGSSDGTRRRRLDAATHSRRYLQVFSQDVKKSIVAISSEAEDAQNRNYDCVTPPAEEGVVCQPMTGFMTIYYEKARLSSEDGQEQLKQGILDTIASGMESDVYSIGVVQRLAYIGDTREGLTPAPTTPAPTAPASSEDNEIVINANNVDAANDNSQGKGGILGTTEISLMSTAAFLFILIAAVGLYVLPKRRRKGNGTTMLHDDSFEVDVRSTGGNSLPSWHSTQIMPVPIEQKHSLEGSEIPGSLAAMDTLALKPQFQRSTVIHESPSSDQSYGPALPPGSNKNYMHHRDTISVASALESFEVTNTPENSNTATTNRPPTKIRLSPIQNQKSGVPPSQVSPNRSSPLTRVSPAHTSSSDEHSQIVNQLIREIESGTPLSKTFNKTSPTPPTPTTTPRSNNNYYKGKSSSSKHNNAMDALKRIVASDSESDKSFRDSESGTRSPFYHHPSRTQSTISTLDNMPSSYSYSYR